MASEAAIAMALDMLSQTQQAAKPITPGLKAAWMFAMAGVDDASFRDAVLRHMQASKFWPAPAEILEQVQGSSSDQAEALWLVVESTIAKHGRYASVSFHPAANAAVRSLGGWQKLCESTADEMVFRRKDFLTSVRTWLRHSPGEQGGHLVGLVEADHVRRQLPWGGEVKLCGPGAVAPAERVEALPEGGNVVRLVSAIAAKTGGGR